MASFDAYADGYITGGHIIVTNDDLSREYIGEYVSYGIHPTRTHPIANTYSLLCGIFPQNCFNKC